MAKSDTYFRIAIPDSHGSYINKAAKKAFLADLDRLGPGVEEIVWLGDHADMAGPASNFEPESLEEQDYDLDDDWQATNEFIDEVSERAPQAEQHYLGGNHENHWERLIARHFKGKIAEKMVKRFGPEGMLNLKKRGINYYAFNKFHHGLAFRNTIKLGKCYFTHGWTAAVQATRIMLMKFGHSFVHGHTHRATEVAMRTVNNDAILGACPGTLADLQPCYMRTTPTEHTHGYGLQIVSRKTQFFQHINAKIVNGVSMLDALLDRLEV